MEESFNKDNREDIFFLSQSEQAKGLTFFDVKETRGGEKFFTITESKRKFNKRFRKFFF